MIDPGSHTTRIGFAGEDIPRIVLPSYVGVAQQPQAAQPDADIDMDTDARLKKRQNTYYSEQQLEYPKPNAELLPILKDSQVQDWDAAVEQWDYALTQLSANVSEQPLLLTEPVWNSIENRKKSIEVALETFEFPAFYLASTPTCVAFSVGRPNALVVDVGHDVASVSPVIDGMCLGKSTLKTHYAGRFVSANLRSKITADIIPLYKLGANKPNFSVTKTFDDYQMEKTLHQIKEVMVSIPSVPIKDSTEVELDAFPAKKFELPNKEEIELSKERFEVGDSIFDPEHYQDLNEFEPESGEPEITTTNDYVPMKRTKAKDDDEDEAAKKAAAKLKKYRGLGELTSHALSLVDVDLRAQLANNIIVTGASSLIPGLNDRLSNEVNKLHPGLKIRIYSSGQFTDRKFQSWIGGSVLASLGTFHQLWVSKKEYEEVGIDKLLSQRFR